MEQVKLDLGVQFQHGSQMRRVGMSHTVADYGQMAGMNLDRQAEFSGKSHELVEQVVSKLDNRCHCYVMQNHGALCLGQTIDKAQLNAELLEKAARIYYYSLLSGDEIRVLPDDIVSFISDVREALYFQKS